MYPNLKYSDLYYITTQLNILHTIKGFQTKLDVRSNSFFYNIELF